MSGFASEDLEQKYAAQQRGELTPVDVPGGGRAWVKTGAATHALPDGRILRIEWVETFPAKPTSVTIEGPVSDRAAVAVALIQDAAREVAEIDGVPPRDRNAIIGQLRNVAAQIRGISGLPDWPSVPFSPPRA